MEVFTLVPTNALIASPAPHHGDHYDGDAPEGYIIRHQDSDLEDAFYALRKESISIRTFSRNQNFGIDEFLALPYAICILKLFKRHNLITSEKLNNAIGDLTLRLKSLMSQIEGTNRERISRLSLMFDALITLDVCCWFHDDKDYSVLYDFDLQPGGVTLYMRREQHETPQQLNNSELKTVSHQAFRGPFPPIHFPTQDTTGRTILGPD